MNNFKRLIVLIFIIALSACSNEREPDSIIIAQDGTKYTVLERQNLLFNGDKMFVVKYISRDPKSEEIRNKEFEDIYFIIAKHIDPNSDYDYVALVAATKPRKKFGITTDSIYRDRRPFSEVIALNKMTHNKRLQVDGSLAAHRD